MADVATQITTMSTDVLAIAGTVIAAALGLVAVKFGVKWAVGLFSSVGKKG